MPIDVVYILGKESRWLDNEIKYSLRSVQQHLIGYRNIYLIGEKPEFLNDRVIEIPYQDVYGNKARNIMSKIHRAACDKRISNNFMLFNDDYFLLKTTDSELYPYYYKNTLYEAIEKNLNNYDFQSHIRQTVNALEENNLPLLNFDSHYPILYNKKQVKNVIAKYNWNVPYGHIFKSLYCNTLKIPGEHKEDCKIDHPHVFENWPVLTKNFDMFSIGDRCINKSMHQYFEYLYPQKSRYEK